VSVGGGSGNRGGSLKSVDTTLVGSALSASGNTFRPHSAPGNLSPATYAALSAPLHHRAPKVMSRGHYVVSNAETAFPGKPVLERRLK
jgi:hypothetical protein